MSIKSLIKTIFFGTLFKYACTIIRLQMHVRQRLCTSDICQPWNFGSECISDNRSRHILTFSYYSSSKLTTIDRLLISMNIPFLFDVAPEKEVEDCQIW